MANYDVFNSNLARAGRALTGIDRQDIWKFERGIMSLPKEQQEAIKHVLIDYGALFLPDSEAGGYGVRLKHSRAKAKQIDRWEAEGGPTGEDDV